VTSVVRAFWTWAEEQGHVPFSPAAKLRRPRAPRKSAPLLPRNTDARLLNVTRTPRDRAARLLLFDAGLRRNELTSVRVQDIDLSRRQSDCLRQGADEPGDPASREDRRGARALHAGAAALPRPRSGAALGHSDLSTTAAIYGHYDLSDLERAMEALAKARRAETEEPAD
jgi:site-specific recombinase XerC